MPPRDEQQQIGKAKIGVGQARRQRVTLKVVDRNQRLARGVRQRFGGHQPDHDAADQSRPRSRCNGINVGKAQVCVGQRRLDQRHDRLDMRTRGDFGDNTAKGRMRRLLPGQTMRKHVPVARHNRSCGLIAARFNT